MSRYDYPASPQETPRAVEGLLARNFQPVNPLFNLAIENPDGIVRHDLVHPETEERLLWTPHSDQESEAIIQELVGDAAHPVFFPVESKDEEGALRKLPLNVALLINTLNNAPYIDEYMQSLQHRANVFLGKMALIDSSMAGIDIADIVVNHNGGTRDDVFFSLVPPLKPIARPYNMSQKKLEIRRLEKSSPEHS